MDTLQADRRNVGIRMILAAEQEAQQIVNAARAEKLAKLKQAKEEAQKEVVAHRELLEFELQKKTGQISEDSGANMKRLEQEVEGRINHLQLDAGRIRRDVVCVLLKHVMTKVLQARMTTRWPW